MRVISGEFRGRKLATPRGDETRPTADRVKEAMFSMLGPLEGTRVLDLFAGSGALGIEALSRGASHAVFVEQSRPALGALGENLKLLGLESRTSILGVAVARSTARVLALGPFDVALVDPPYAEVADGSVPVLLGTLIERGALPPGAILLLEHATRDPVPVIPGTEPDRSRKYGTTTVSIYIVA